MVAGFCRDRGLFLISDEVYREFVYDGARGDERAHAARACEEHVVVVDSLSKRYSACGIRLGCLVDPQPRGPRSAPAHGPGPAVAARAWRRWSPSARASWAPTTRAASSTEYQQPARRAVRGAVRDPRRLPAQARRRVLLRGPPAGARQRGLRALAAHRLPEGRRHGDGGARARASTRRPGLGANEVRIAYVLKEADLRAAVDILAAGLEAYRKTRNPTALPSAAVEEEVDFHVPAEG